MALTTAAVSTTAVTRDMFCGMSTLHLQGAITVAFLASSVSHAQVTAADYDRARGLQQRYDALVVNAPEAPVWLPSGHFWYRKSVPGGNTFAAS